MTSSRPVSIHQFTVFRFRFKCSRRFNPEVLIIHRSFSPVPGVMLSSFGANPQAVHFVKEYTPWVEHTRKENHKYDHIYTTNESSLVQHISKMRGHVHNCPFENIWFAISQPLCIMYMSIIYTVECRYNAIQCYKIFHTTLRGLKHDVNLGCKSHIIPHIWP